jgi:hypothetical protein
MKLKFVHDEFRQMLLQKFPGSEKDVYIFDVIRGQCRIFWFRFFRPLPLST